MGECLHCGFDETLDPEGLCYDCAIDAVEAAETAADLRADRDDAEQERAHRKRRKQFRAELGVSRCSNCTAEQIRAKGLCRKCYQYQWDNDGRPRPPEVIRRDLERREAHGRMDGPRESRVRLGDGTLDPGPETVTRPDYQDRP